MDHGTTVFFDLETAGLAPEAPDIQIGAVAWSGGEIVGEFEAKIAFDVSLAEPRALDGNSYNPIEWEALAQNEVDVVRKFADWLSGHATVERISKAGRPYKIARLAGHNVVQFDGPRLHRMFARHDRFLPATVYQPHDVLQLALWYFSRVPGGPKSYRLVDLCEHFGVKLDNAHDALADAKATALVAWEMIEGFA